jgi:beta-lactamase class A
VAKSKATPQAFVNIVQKIQNTPQEAKETGQLSTLKTAIVNYTSKYQGEYGVYFYDLTTGQEFGINDDDQFTSASCEKIPINLYLDQRIQSGAVNLQATLTYTQADDEDGTGSIQYQPVGTQYTIDELSKLSITQSDNVAANMLIGYLGMTNIKNYMRQVGGQVVVDDQNVSCPSDMGLYLKLAYHLYESGSPLGSELMSNLENTDFNDRLPALLPQSVKVAHKIGSELHVINDAGIVYANHPYILVVMSKNINDAEAPAVIANISKTVYGAVSQL